jgi:cell wall-associated NlpC family hydrolase
VWPYLETYGWDASMAAKVGLLAHLALATDYTLLVAVEPYDYDRAERLYGHLTAVGQALGNVYPGDGYRYRGRGLLPLRGRAAYARVGELLGVPLVEEPELALDVTLAAGALAIVAHERGFLAAADRGDWEGAARALDPTVNRWEPFLRAVQVFSDEANQAPDTPHPVVGPDARAAAYERAVARVGDAYREGGDGARGFDAVGLVAWAYQEVTGVTLAAYPDALELETVPIRAEDCEPGDLVLYGYADLARPDLKWPHVAMVTPTEGVVLDVRVGQGVGYHAHVQGAVRHYRRIRVEAAQVEADEAMWREKYEALFTELVKQVEAERATHQQYTSPPGEEPAPKAAKALWVDHAQTLAEWAEQTNQIVTDLAGSLDARDYWLAQLRQEVDLGKGQ